MNLRKRLSEADSVDCQGYTMASRRNFVVASGPSAIHILETATARIAESEEPTPGSYRKRSWRSV